MNPQTMSNEDNPFIGTKPCPSCGATDGDHSESCKTRKAHPEEVQYDNFSLFLEIRLLKEQVKSLQRKVSDLEASTGPIG